MEGLNVIYIEKLLTRSVSASDYPLIKFGTTQVYRVELSQIFRKFLKDKYNYSHLQDYTIYIFKRGNSRTFKIYCDTTYYFVLCKKSRRVLRTRLKQIACIGFEDTSYDGSITIKQIQGRRGMQKELASIRWEKLLVEITKNWAQQNGYSAVKIIGARGNPWYYSSISLSDKMHLKYDVTARRSGFKFIPEENIYVLNFS